MDREVESRMNHYLDRQQNSNPTEVKSKKVKRTNPKHPSLIRSKTSPGTELRRRLTTDLLELSDEIEKFRRSTSQQFELLNEEFEIIKTSVEKNDSIRRALQPFHAVLTFYDGEDLPEESSEDESTVQENSKSESNPEPSGHWLQKSSVFGSANNSSQRQSTLDKRKGNSVEEVKNRPSRNSTSHIAPFKRTPSQLDNNTSRSVAPVPSKASIASNFGQRRNSLRSSLRNKKGSFSKRSKLQRTGSTSSLGKKGHKKRKKKRVPRDLSLTEAFKFVTNYSTEESGCFYIGSPNKRKEILVIEDSIAPVEAKQAESAQEFSFDDLDKLLCSDEDHNVSYGTVEDNRSVNDAKLDIDATHTQVQSEVPLQEGITEKQKSFIQSTEPASKEALGGKTDIEKPFTDTQEGVESIDSTAQSVKDTPLRNSLDTKNKFGRENFLTEGSGELSLPLNESSSNLHLKKEIRQDIGGITPTPSSTPTANIEQGSVLRGTVDRAVAESPLGNTSLTTVTSTDRSSIPTGKNQAIPTAARSVRMDIAEDYEELLSNPNLTEQDRKRIAFELKQKRKREEQQQRQQKLNESFQDKKIVVIDRETLELLKGARTGRGQVEPSNKSLNGGREVNNNQPRDTFNSERGTSSATFAPSLVIHDKATDKAERINFVPAVHPIEVDKPTEIDKPKKKDDASVKSILLDRPSINDLLASSSFAEPKPAMNPTPEKSPVIVESEITPSEQVADESASSNLDDFFTREKDIPPPVKAPVKQSHSQESRVSISDEEKDDVLPLGKERRTSADNAREAFTRSRSKSDSSYGKHKPRRKYLISNSGKRIKKPVGLLSKDDPSKVTFSEESAWLERLVQGALQQKKKQEEEEQKRGKLTKTVSLPNLGGHPGLPILLGSPLGNKVRVEPDNCSTERKVHEPHESVQASSENVIEDTIDVTNRKSWLENLVKENVTRQGAVPSESKKRLPSPKAVPNTAQQASSYQVGNGQVRADSVKTRPVQNFHEDVIAPQEEVEVHSSPSHLDQSLMSEKNNNQKISEQKMETSAAADENNNQLSFKELLSTYNKQPQQMNSRTHSDKKPPSLRLGSQFDQNVQSPPTLSPRSEHSDNRSLTPVSSASNTHEERRPTQQRQGMTNDVDHSDIDTRSMTGSEKVMQWDVNDNSAPTDPRPTEDDYPIANIMDRISMFQKPAAKTDDIIVQRRSKPDSSAKPRPKSLAGNTFMNEYIYIGKDFDNLSSPENQTAPIANKETEKPRQPVTQSPPKQRTVPKQAFSVDSVSQWKLDASDDAIRKLGATLLGGSSHNDESMGVIEPYQQAETNKQPNARPMRDIRANWLAKNNEGNNSGDDDKDVKNPTRISRIQREIEEMEAREKEVRERRELFQRTKTDQQASLNGSQENHPQVAPSNPKADDSHTKETESSTNIFKQEKKQRPKSMFSEREQRKPGALSLLERERLEEERRRAEYEKERELSRTDRSVTVI